MKTVLYLPMISDDPSSYYRMVGVLSHINHPELQFKNIKQDETYSWATLTPCDILIAQRPSTEAHIWLIELAKDMGIRVIVDFDDDLFNVPVHTNAVISLSDQKKNIKQCINLSDEVWVTTEALKTLYKPFNRNVHIIPNALNDYVHPVDQKMPFNPDKKTEFNPNGKLAVYRGGASHNPDLYQNINDLVYTIRDNSDWEFRFMAGGGYSELNNRTIGLTNHTYTEAVTLIQFFKIYNNFNAQIAFFPLVNNQFNRSKSSISFLEATYAGSCFLGNKELPEFDLPFIVDISEGLYEPMESISKQFDKMQELNEQSWQWIQENRLLSNINQLRIERLLV